MRRASAVKYLMDRRRAWQKNLLSSTNGDIESVSPQIDLIDRLILDVRAARMHTFELTDSRPLQIYLTND